MRAESGVGTSLLPLDNAQIEMVLLNESCRCWDAGASDLAGQMSAAFAAAAIVFRQEDSAYSDLLRNRSITLYDAANLTKGSLADVDLRRNVSTTCISSRTGPFPSNNTLKKVIPPRANGSVLEYVDTPDGCISNTTRYVAPDDPSLNQSDPDIQNPKLAPVIDYNGTAQGYYDSISFYDDLMWSAAWLARLTGTSFVGSCIGPLSRNLICTHSSLLNER